MNRSLNSSSAFDTSPYLAHRRRAEKTRGIFDVFPQKYPRNRALASGAGLSDCEPRGHYYPEIRAHTRNTLRDFIYPRSLRAACGAMFA